MVWLGEGCNAFMVRSVYVGLCCGVLLGLFIYPTEFQIREDQGDILQPLLFLVLVFSSMLLYFVVSLMDPGYVKYETEEEPVSNKMEASNPPDVVNLPLKHCPYCLVKQPLRSKHCRSCQFCVRRYDHHCPWVANCIGERNHPVFVIYLFVQLVVLMWAMPVAWSGLRFEYFSWAWLHLNLLLLLSFAVIAIFTVVMVLLLISHLYLVSHNITTWEFMSHHRIFYLKDCEVDNPFDRGIVRNIWQFFCTFHYITWENLYTNEKGPDV